VGYKRPITVKQGPLSTDDLSSTREKNRGLGGVSKKLISRYMLSVGFPTGIVNFLPSGSRREISLFNRRVPNGKYPILAVGFPTCRRKIIISGTERNTL